MIAKFIILVVIGFGVLGLAMLFSWGLEKLLDSIFDEEF